MFRCKIFFHFSPSQSENFCLRQIFFQMFPILILFLDLARINGKIVIMQFIASPAGYSKIAQEPLKYHFYVILSILAMFSLSLSFAFQPKLY